MTDRELLENAAKAAGIAAEWLHIPSTSKGCLYVKTDVVTEVHGHVYDPWNPLTDDGDSFRLLAALHKRFDLSLEVIDFWMSLVLLPPKDNHDPLAALRKAIVSAAAELGRRGAKPIERFDDFSTRVDREARAQRRMA